MKITLPAAGAIKMKTAFIRSSSQVDKMHQQKQKWRRLGSAAFKQVCLEAQKMKTAKLAGAVGPFLPWSTCVRPRISNLPWASHVLSPRLCTRA